MNKVLIGIVALIVLVGGALAASRFILSRYFPGARVGQQVNIQPLPTFATPVTTDTNVSPVPAGATPVPRGGQPISSPAKVPQGGTASSPVPFLSPRVEPAPTGAVLPATGM